MRAVHVAGTPRSGGWRDDALLLALALLARLLHGLALRADPLFDWPQIDARLFWQSAQALAQGQGAEAVFYKPPLLSYLLAGLIALFGAQAGAARLVLLALSALAAPLTARLARPLLGRGAAFLAGALMALCAPAVFYGGELLPASLVLLLDLGLLLLLARAERSGAPAWHAAAGALLGLSALAWPTILLLLPLLLVRYRRRPRMAALLLLGALLLVAPAAIHNARGGDFVPVSANGGVNAYLGNHAGADGRSARAPDLPPEPGAAAQVAARLAEAAAGRALEPSEVSRYWLDRALAWTAAHPLDAAWLLAKKAYFAVNNADISDNIDLRAAAEASPALRWLPVHFGLLFALALPGFAVLRREQAGRLLLVYALAVALPLLLFFVVGRFRLPLLPVLAIAAAAGVRRLWRARTAGIRTIAGPAALVIGGLLLSHSALLGVAQDSTWHYYTLQGEALYRQGRLDRAIAAYEESLRRNPQAPATMNALAYLYAEQGSDLERAESLARSALAQAPRLRAHALDTLGWVLFRRGDLPGATAALEEAIAGFAPWEARQRADAVAHLAAVRRAQGLPAEAIPPDASAPAGEGP